MRDPIGSPLSLPSVRLWEGRAPGATGDRPENVPTLTFVEPSGAPSTGTTVIVAPSSGYTSLATGQEGGMVADWLASHGVHAFVPTYRLPPAGHRHSTQLLDAQRANRWVRAHAAELSVGPKRIGIIGFSAGGHLTAMAETQFEPGAPDPSERVSSWPDFAMLVYPAIELSEARTLSLLTPGIDEATRRALAPARNVRAHTPPTFLLHTTTDPVTPATNSTLFYNALLAAKVPGELHVFGGGRTDSGSAWPIRR